MIGHLKNVFLDMLILALSTIITPTVFEYICKSFKLCPMIRLYRESLDKANITYMVSEIVKPNFEDLGFFVPDSGKAGSIPRTMIFIDDIDEAQHVAAYLYTRLFL